ncbi:MAG: T9SS type A sorting domain-containing protein [Sphingobacteriales bacterium]|nr:MAG: T9SS type A sorting domain-containing protein [Sphingobacteriales bacterium]
MKQFWIYITICFCILWYCILLSAQNPVDFCKGLVIQTIDSSSIFRDIIRLSNNTYVAVGEVRILPNSIQDKLTIVNFNICGNILWRKQIFYANSGFSDYHIVYVDENSFVVACAYTSNLYENPYYDILSLKFDNSGDVIWSKIFSNGFYTDAPTCITALDDGGVMIGGFSYNFPDNDAYSQAWLIKVDSEGNTEWSKTYGFATASETIRSIVQNGDGTYTIAAQRVHNSSSSLWIFKTDSEGNILWNRILGNGYWTVASQMIPYQDGYMIVGIEQPYIWNIGNAFVLKIDTLGSQEWMRYYGNGIVAEFSNIIKLPDDDLIAIGSNRFNSSGSIHFDAWMMKLNAEGDSIWSNTYAYNGTIPIDDYVWGLSETEEGGFMMAGFTSVFNADSTTLTQTAWVVRTDSLGNSCYIPEGCEWAVGIDSFLPPAPLKRENFIQVYPNPAQNTLQITLPDHSAGSLSGAETSFTLYNLTGQLVLQTQIPAGETHKTVSVAHLPEGVYVYVVTAGEGVLARGKVAVVRK